LRVFRAGYPARHSAGGRDRELIRVSAVIGAGTAGVPSAAFAGCASRPPVMAARSRSESPLLQQFGPA
jgi:hypothetical protein